MKLKKSSRVIQIIFGLILLFFGLNGLLQFVPGDLSGFKEPAANFMVALFSTGYMVPLMSVVWVLAGIFFVFNKYSALGSLMIFPITVNILLFHIFLDFNGWWFALIFVILNVYMLKIHWKSFEKVFDK